MADDTSRRDVLRGAATASVAAASIVAATAAEAQVAAAPMVDPTTKYPRPPFAVQSQPWPGLQRNMIPVPDCGETSYKGSGRLAGRKALVTGGDSGIGRAAVIAFSREGADVAINYYPSEEPDAQDVAKLLRGEGRKIVLIPGDIREESFCRSLVTRAARELGGLDILVNNAAHQKAATALTDITDADFDWTMKTNIYGTFRITKAALPLMKPGSCIINTSSVNAYDAGKDIVDYAMTKAAIMAFTKGLAKQLSPKGIRVNAVAPGPVWTPLQVSGGQTPEGLQKFGSDTPLGRAGAPAELAPLYVLLADNDASYTSGSLFGANGGTGIT